MILQLVSIIFIICSIIFNARSADADLLDAPGCLFPTATNRFMVAALGPTFSNRHVCPLGGQETDSSSDGNGDNALHTEKSYYLCGGRLSKMPAWFRSRQAALIPTVHVVNASLFFSSSRNKQQQQDSTESSQGENATMSAASDQEANNVDEPASSKDAETDNWCMLVNFFAPQCPFSAKLAPNYNALARNFPDLFVAAVDATQNAKLNLIFGISGTPTILLFQNGRPVARYDHSDYELKSLVEFMTKQTDLVPADVNAHEEDQFGPLADFIKEPGTDYYLLASWYFIAFCSIYCFLTSSLAARLVETIKRNWREMNEE